MKTPKANGTNPKILEWARKNAGYKIEEVAKKMNKKVDKFSLWETGEDVPTFKQLSKLSKIYRYPSAFFFDDTIPKSRPLPVDYRTMPYRPVENFPEIKFEIESANEKREIALDLSNKLGLSIHNFDLNCSIDDNPEEVANNIRDYLEIPIEKQFKWVKEEYSSLNNWKTILEQKGVIVFQFSGIAPKEIRGYSINKKPLPVIGVNTGDSPNTRNFSIFHEIAHIVSGTAGVCNMENRDKKIERFCDSVAGNFLIPSNYLLNEKLVKENDGMIWDKDDLYKLSKKYSVSMESMLIALIDNKKSTWKFYKKTKEEWQRKKDIENQKSEDIHIPYHKRVSSWNGKYYMSILFEAYNNKLINRNNLSSYLGDVKIEHIHCVC
ncbi:MAG: XRE family transcriptional regulator [Methanobrevibacter sp.]|jgi:Zn-dependent peptidase ImmA (M78 family)|nr:XRE family transcriptional regulator [Candidatus Methanovirga meridionalis]